MTLYDLISCETLINDDTRLGVIIYDPARGVAIRQVYGQWFEDRILNYVNWTVERFTYFAEQNRFLIRITCPAFAQEGATQ